MMLERRAQGGEGIKRMLGGAALAAVAMTASLTSPAWAAQATSAREARLPTGDEASSKPAAGPRMAQFQLPQPAAQGGPGRPETPFLKYQYSIGSESDITFRSNRDLDRRLRDDTLILAPQVNGYVIYRPNARVETMLEMILESEIAAKEEKRTTLPSGEIVPAENRHTILVVDQAFVRFKDLGPAEVTVGRMNFEDDRHWLYDTSLDAAHLKLRHNSFQAELSVAQKDWLDLDALNAVPRSRITNYILYVSYHGIEDTRLAGYTIYSRDGSGKEGRPLHLGLRASGAPSDRFNYWTELAWLRGRDEFERRFSAHAFDMGATYRFNSVRLQPSVTLGYAFGSGDGNPDDHRNTEFRQTGLHSNEWRMSGVTSFKYYGEGLDPELSNLQILTAGVGLRLAPTVHLDLVYHRYRLNKLAEGIRNAALTAEMNQDETMPSRDVGSGLDVILGFRNLFGVRRLGLDLRAGWFFPGTAYRNNMSEDSHNPRFRRADKGFAMLAKFWW